MAWNKIEPSNPTSPEPNTEYGIHEASQAAVQTVAVRQITSQYRRFRSFVMVGVVCDTNESSMGRHARSGSPADEELARHYLASGKGTWRGCMR